jgi:hypothetical protein
MGIKVWIMKGEVYGKRDLSTCWNGQNNWYWWWWRFSEEIENFNKGGNQTLKESKF